MLTRLAKKNHQKGFTLIELLIVVAIIGIIAALLIPNFLDALQKAKQKRTMADMRNVGNAAFSWITDQVGAAAAGQGATQYDVSAVPSISAADIRTALVPQYIQDVPQRDGWKHDYEWRLNTADPLAQQVAAFRSAGRGGTFDGTTYQVSAFTPTDYEQDIVWADGTFVRWPQKIQ